MSSEEKTQNNYVKKKTTAVLIKVLFLAMNFHMLDTCEIFEYVSLYSFYKLKIKKKIKLNFSDNR